MWQTSGGWDRSTDTTPSTPCSATPMPVSPPSTWPITLSNILSEIYYSGIWVIFPALDIRVKNVAKTYSLEHKGENNLFDHLFELLNSSTHNDESFARELASCTGALQTSVSQHMAKEEEQV
ncbi:zinc finger protein BRUTUS isoform X1 [Arachis duranensis]|uniref:Zinc finger protein BRUTUS isoform X1 n=1 Tax=Arachis duranensis TaxID=130453 RepID=A0A9C6WMJ1_ARADU|nr:zinc finger protein BRUTUS isoform X1 [Arachis duranensis]